MSDKKSRELSNDHKFLSVLIGGNISAWMFVFCLMQVYGDGNWLHSIIAANLSAVVTSNVIGAIWIGRL